MTVRPYPFGFIFSDTDFAIPDLETRGFRNRTELGRWTMFTQDDEPVQVAGDSNLGVVWLGHATSVESDEAPPSMAGKALELLSNGERDFHVWLDYVVGRWAALIFVDGSVRVYNDTLASQPVYIAREEGLAGSHLPLIHEELNLRRNEEIELGSLGQHRLWDETEDPRVAYLPANFYFEFSKRELVRFYPYGQINQETMEIEKASQLAALLGIRSVKYWAKQPFRLYCALTAGMDTRVSAALSLGAGSSPTFVTYGSVSPRTKDDGVTAKSYKIDVTTASRISSDLKVKSLILPIEEASRYALSDEDREILRGNTCGSHAVNFQGLYEHYLGTSPSICFVGTGLEIFEDYFVHLDRPVAKKAEFRRVVGGVAGFTAQRRGRTLGQEEADQLWSAYQYDKVANSRFPVGNILYQELRAGRFQSEAINCQATAFLPINPIAIRKVLELPQQYSVYDRKDKRFSQLLIRDAFPPLAGYQVNGKDFYTDSRSNIVDKKILSGSSFDGVVEDHDQNIPDIILLDQQNLKPGCEVFFRDYFGETSGSLRITFESPYSIGREVQNVVHFLRVNGVEQFTKGIGQGGRPFTLLVEGLVKSDEVDFGLRSNGSNGIAWVNASWTRLTEWKEIPESIDRPMGIMYLQYGSSKRKWW